MGQRDRLIAEWALTTGMRRMEIANFQLSELPAQSLSSEATLVAVELSTTKGGKARQVYPPLPLIDRTWSYVREERAVATERAARRGQASGNGVFLTSRATAMSPRRVGSVFYEAARKVGDPVTFHRLRHLFAATMLNILQREAVGRSDIKPLLALQTLLGHESIETTMIYLDVIAADIAHIDVGVVDVAHQSHEAFGTCRSRSSEEYRRHRGRADATCMACIVAGPDSRAATRSGRLRMRPSIVVDEANCAPDHS
jgi:site-specific recombinase XerD